MGFTASFEEVRLARSRNSQSAQPLFSLMHLKYLTENTERAPRQKEFMGEGVNSETAVKQPIGMKASGFTVDTRCAQMLAWRCLQDCTARLVNSGFKRS